MAAAFFKFLSFVFFLAIIGNGNCQCDYNNIKVINQIRTGFQIHGATEWKVNITNDCPCLQSQVKLNCTGFESTLSIDPAVVNVIGDECLLSDPIFPKTFFNFTYAWDPQFTFKPISSEVACSASDALIITN